MNESQNLIERIILPFYYLVDRNAVIESIHAHSIEPAKSWSQGAEQDKAARLGLPSIVQLLEVTGNLLVSGYSFLSRVYQAPGEIRSLLREVANLNALLDQLQSLAIENPVGVTNENARKEGSRNALQTLEGLGVFADCSKLMLVVRRTLQTCEQVEGRQVKNLSKKVLWPFKERETKDLIAQLGRLREALSAAVVVDSSKTLGELEILAKSIDSGVIQALSRDSNGIMEVQITTQTTVGDVGYIKDILEARIEQEEYANIRRWLYPEGTNAEAGFTAALGTKQSETGKWIFDSKDFRAWRESTHGWCGKTVLSATVVEHLQLVSTLPSTCVLYFFCDHRIPNMQSLQDLLYVIVKQLLDQSPGYFKDAKYWYDERTRPVEGSKPAAKPLSASEYIKFIQQLCLRWESISLVVDALDECSRLDTFIDGLSKLLSGSNIKLLLTSRQSIDFTHAIDPIADYKISLVENMRDDIDIYLTTEIRSRLALGTLKFKEKGLEALIVSALREKADGMILIAKLQLDYIGRLKSDRAIKEALIKLPSSIYETYDEILDQLCRKNPDDIQEIKRILQWLLCSRVPLTLEELAEAISIRPGDETLDESGIATDVMDLAACCGSLVTINTEMTSHGQYEDLRGPQVTLITLAHASVEEYFKSGNSGLSMSLGFHMDMENLHYELAKTCLQYIGFEDFELPIDNENIHGENADPSESTLVRHRRCLRSRTSKYALVDYASRYWADHLRLSKFSKFLDKQTIHLLDWFINPANHGGKYISWQQMYHHDIEWYCHGRPPLFYAIQFQIEGLVEFLLPPLEELNDTSYENWHRTPLHVAAENGALNIAQELLRRGASVDVKSHPEAKSMTALHYAAEGRHTEVIKLLLRCGASVHARSSSMSTPFYRAARSGSLKSLKVLYLAGSDINARTWDNWTPLFESVAHGRSRIASQLLEWGADPTIITNKGESTLKILATVRDMRAGTDPLHPVTEDDILKEIKDIWAQGECPGGFTEYLKGVKGQYVMVYKTDGDSRPGIEREKDFRHPHDVTLDNNTELSRYGQLIEDIPQDLEATISIVEKAKRIVAEL
ncbi:hypothetical protein V495_06869 [Pseudogymnoascus sp. VKM F-4514 (FW-929)]|nr:hypothetical protein V495_06869 [Pseudogymnoascus sp. VKM F-4514 (FW-929)]KFY64796.1 hypothetical protein V497_01585 [Pseudogymnoascus sp. VKM F-4516 (FW-969)]